MASAQRGSLGVLSVPFAFSQASVMKSDAFIREAKNWGRRLDLDVLEDLQHLGLLVPFYRVEDEPADEWAVPGDERDLSLLGQYARAGYLRDPMLEDRSIRWPYRTPEGAESWWNGFYYGRWQLLEVAGALNARELIGHLPDELVNSAAYAERTRVEHLALAALSDRFLPPILGKATYSAEMDREAVLVARFDHDAKSRLAAAGLPAERLRPAAEFMLGHADAIDPMKDWWDLIRHAGHDGWSRMSGRPLEAVWWRIGAEVLLRAHEELADEGLIEPLPDFEADPPRVHHPLMERPGRPQLAMSLERSLARYGLSPHSRVLLVVEGESELRYVGALLEAVGLSGTHLVRLIVQGTSSDWPWQLASTIVPRLGAVAGDRRLLDSMPTALMIAMDPEGHWATQAEVDLRRANLQRRVAEQVAAQGSELAQDELDILVQARNWGEFTFELANFTDAELEAALQSVALRLQLPGTDAADWQQRLSDAIAHVRDRKLDIKVVFQRMQWPEHKIALADELVPVLVGKLHHEHDDPAHTHAPAVQLVYDVHETVQRLSGPGFSISAAPPE